MKKRKVKKLTLNKESILRLDSTLREVVGGVSLRCTGSAECTESCQHSCACASVLC